MIDGPWHHRLHGDALKPSRRSQSERSVVDHTYRDRLHDPYLEDNNTHRFVDPNTTALCGNNSTNQGCQSTQRGEEQGDLKAAKTPFPEKLHRILAQLEHDGLNDVVSWQPHGRAFRIHRKKEFVETIMPLFFHQSKLSSFQRQLNLYGFNRLCARGPDRGSYYHEFFLRRRRDLCRRITRTRIKGNGMKPLSSPMTEPNFYVMEYCGEETTPPSQRAEQEESSHHQRSNDETSSESACSLPPDSGLMFGKPASSAIFPPIEIRCDEENMKSTGISYHWVCQSSVTPPSQSGSADDEDDDGESYSSLGISSDVFTTPREFLRELFSSLGEKAGERCPHEEMQRAHLNLGIDSNRTTEMPPATAHHPLSIESLNQAAATRPPPPSMSSTMTGGLQSSTAQPMPVESGFYAMQSAATTPEIELHATVAFDDKVAGSPGQGVHHCWHHGGQTSAYPLGPASQHNWRRNVDQVEAVNNDDNDVVVVLSRPQICTGDAVSVSGPDADTTQALNTGDAVYFEGCKFRYLDRIKLTDLATSHRSD